MCPYVGAFGKVYRGTMRGGAAGSHRKSREVAIKTIKSKSVN